MNKLKLTGKSICATSNGSFAISKITRCLFLAVGLMAMTPCSAADANPDLEAELSKPTPKDAWVDPVKAVPQGCQYVIYPTAQRAEDTEGSALVYLPDGYKKSKQRYPVIYYLHGGTGNQREARWMIERIDRAIKAGTMQPVIVVSPQSLPVGWYLNGRMESPTVTTGPLEDILIKDLIPYVDSHYRTIASREGRGIEGFSMGGGAAMRLSMKYPELFCAASSVAGAVVHWDEEPLKRALECTFGEYGDPASKAYFDANIPEVFAERNRDEIINNGMAIRIFVGTKDRLYEENGVNIIPRFSSYLSSLSIPHSLTVIPDVGHNPWEMFGEGHLVYDTAFWEDAFYKTGEVKVGAGKAVIAMPDELFPYKSPHERNAYTGVHDSLYVRAVVVDNGFERVVMAEIDEVDVPHKDAMTHAIASVAGIDANHVLLCSSHTHSTLHGEAPSETVYVEAARNAVADAVSNLQPGRIAFGRTQAFANVNNGELAAKGGQYDYDGFSDKTLDIMRFIGVDGNVIAMMLNYPTHAEVMFRSVTMAGGYEVSGDLPGRVAEILENMPEGAPVVLVTEGAAGDQLPLFSSSQRTKRQGAVDQGKGGWAVLDVLARRIVDAVVCATDSMSIGSNRISLTIAKANAMVPGQRMSRQTGEFQITEDIAIPLTLISLGQTAIEGVGADLAAQIGVDIRNASIFKPTMLVTMAAGSIGYVLTDKAYESKSHGVGGSRVQPGYAQDAIINTFSNLSQQ